MNRPLLSREYYYADHMNAILGIYTDLDEFTDLQCDYGETLEKCERLEKELSKSKTMSKNFESLQKHAINLELDLQHCKEKIKQDKSFKENQSNVFLKEREQYFEIQDLKAKLQDKGIAIILPQNKLPIVKNTNVIAPGMYKVHTKPNHTRTPQLHQDIRKPNKRVSFSTGVIPNTSVSRPQLKASIWKIESCPNIVKEEQDVEDPPVEIALIESLIYLLPPYLKGNDLLTAWLWHRRLSHLNFDTINLLSKNNIVNGLPKLKFVKDHLCSSCELGKAKRKSFHTKTTPSSKRRLQLLHMDLCGPMRVESINGKKYVLVIVDDFSRYTWTHFLRHGISHKSLHAYFAKEGIRHETSTARTPEQNGVVERRNRTLVEAARTMLSAAKVPLFFWAEAIATACFTQNRSLVIPRHEKTPYHIINARKPWHHINVSSDPGPQCSTTVLEQDSLSPGPQSQENVPQVAETVTTSNELELLYSPMFSELLNGTSHVVSKSSAPLYMHPPPLNIHSTHQTPTQLPTVTAHENIIQAETNTENALFDDDEFINIFSTPHNVWTKISIKQVIGNPSNTLEQDPSARNRWRDGYVSHSPVIPNRTKEHQKAMATSAWIESMQAELHPVLITRWISQKEEYFEESFAPVARMRLYDGSMRKLQQQSYTMYQLTLNRHFLRPLKGRSVRKPTKWFVDDPISSLHSYRLKKAL
ncbi:retrovirus-related pol polyprotein from transposon TNT 1-94 [Tanacetum coccineum]